MNITKEWLQKNGACSEGKAWFNGQSETDAKIVILELLKQNHFDWANWTIVRLMTHEQKIKYAIYAAEKVLSIYEAKYPENKAPRNAIKSAKAYLKNPSEENKNAAARAANAAARAAADAAYAAARAAYAADAAGYKLEASIIKYGIKLIGEIK